jgi:hypothetical protein
MGLPSCNKSACPARRVRQRTDGERAQVHAARIMKHETLESGGPADHSAAFSASEAPPPVDVFYVVQSTGVLGERNHCLRSELYETRSQAHMELVRLRSTNSSASYDVWKSTTYIEPAEWLHRVVRSDSTLVLPRLHGLEKFSDD